MPARIEDTKDKIDALASEIASKVAERDLGETDEERLLEAEEEKVVLEARLAELDASFAAEKEIVDRILALRLNLAAKDNAEGEGEEEDTTEELDPEAARAEMYEKMATLDAGNADDRMVYAHVDGQAVASVISDWTGIPAGRMVQDELQAVLQLADRLRERVIGQDHGLAAIAKRIETNRAGLANPNKPIGVFMLCGPSGVGKTETALALAEQLYGGEQNVITINMSEFQEAHTVSLLKGAPPGYVGYGEGGRLTEAVRRKPYSVVLLDEIEKAHPDVHELFFQVFDKGIMEDGNGRVIDFKNTIILLTSNVGTDVIMEMAEAGETTPDMEELEAALKPFQLEVFPPALLGRIVSIPYFPLGRDVLTGIAKLKLGAVERRLKGAHGAVITYADGVIEHIVEQCRDPDSGGRMIDNIITNSILPDLSRQVLSRMVSGDAFVTVEVRVKDDAFREEYTMATDKLEWMLVHKFGDAPIGAVGFLGNDAVSVVAFYDDKDGNSDGKVSIGERLAAMLSPISLEGRNVTEVAMQAKYDLDILQRDASFANMATKLFLNFARGLVLDGIYAVYFSRGVKMSGKGIAKYIGGGTVKEFVIRKGFEKSVKEAFNASTAR
ncbi:Protein ClpV1 [Nymphon striatum]|nr:Protein ClpV1 [Nymphon striatum]